MQPEAVSQERGEDGGYLASPAPRIIGASRRQTTPQREEEKKKTETRNPKSSLSVKAGQVQYSPRAAGPYGVCEIGYKSGTRAPRPSANYWFFRSRLADCLSLAVS